MNKFFALLCAATLAAGSTLHAQERVEIMPPAASQRESDAATPRSAETAQRREGDSATPRSAETTQWREGDAASAAVVVRHLPGEQGPGELQSGEIAVRDRESGEWIVKRDNAQPARTIADLYLEGGWVWMTLITLCLAGMLFSGWKAPRWTKEFGLLALALGVFYMALGFYSILDIFDDSGLTPSFGILCGGLRVTLIAPMYGLGVYMLSLVLRLALKPRI